MALSQGDYLGFEAKMKQEQWLARAAKTSLAEVAGKLHARWPNGLEPGSSIASLANRLRKTDRGEGTAEWWSRHEPLIAVLAEIIARPESEVREWIGNVSSAPASAWSPPGLRNVVAARVDQPPPGLWSTRLRPWVDQVEHEETSVRHGWLTYEPGVAGEWLIAWFQRRGWVVLQAADWKAAMRGLRPRARNLVRLIGPLPADQPPPIAPQGKTVCVLSTHRLAALGAADSAHVRSVGWGPPATSVVSGWAALDEPQLTRPDSCAAWFAEHSRPERRLPDTRINEILREFGMASTPGELLLLLDVAGDPDPVSGLLARNPVVDGDMLRRMEAEAVRRGIGGRRSLRTWTELVPATRTADEVLVDVRRSLSAGNPPQARRLAEGRPSALIEGLVALHVLQPCNEPEVPAGMWRIWPRWLAALLAREAVDAVTTEPGGVGAAVLLGEGSAEVGLAAIARAIGAADWDAVGGALRAAEDTIASMATVEATALVLGHHLLDGHAVPVELAEDAIRSLRRLRRTTAGARLIAHGDGVTSATAVTMADWALGRRARISEPEFGSWEDRSGAVAGAPFLAALEAALERWSIEAQSSKPAPADSSASLGLARRAMRLGSWLYAVHGVLPVPDGRVSGVWSFQVPALLLAASRDVRTLPGRTADEVLNEQYPGANVPAQATAGERLLDSLTPAAFEQPEQLIRGFASILARKAAEDTPDVQARSKAIRAVLDTTSARFSMVKVEIEGTGGSFHDAARWLWEQWNAAPGHGRDVPPVALLRAPDLEDARLIWRCAPDAVHKDIWRRASAEDQFWDVLPPAGWRAWALAANDIPAGWARMPLAVLLSLLDGGVPEGGFAAAWNRDPKAVLKWLPAHLPGGESEDGPARRCLAAVPAARQS